MEIGRREFLKMLGITGTAAVAGSWSAKLMLDVPEKFFERVSTGSLIESWKYSMCSKCPGGCGLKVRLIDGVPVRITGNRNYPVNKGAVCHLAEAGIEQIFHPDRIRQPMKRSGVRGSGSWTPISWDEAFEMLGKNLEPLIENGAGNRVAIVSSARNSATSDIIRKFMNSLSSPNFFHSGYMQSFALPVNFAQGSNLTPGYDFEKADVILNFDFDALDVPVSPVYYNRMYGSSHAVKIHFSSYQSRTAVKSDKWYPIHVGTGAALALGIANVIVRDGTYDRSFVANKTFGFNEWKDDGGRTHLGFRQLVLTDYSPEKVSGITGISASDIVDIARQFAAADSGFAISGGQAVENTNGAFTQYAVYCLNALKGNFNRSGGVLFQDADFLPAASLEGNSWNGDQFLNRPQTMESLVKKSGKKPDIDLLFMHQSNPAVSAKSVFDIRRFMEATPMIVSVGSFMNKSTEMADLFLPEPSALESWDAGYQQPTVPFLHFAVQQPVMETVDDTRQFGDILLELGSRTGGSLENHLPWTSMEVFIQDLARKIYASGVGTIISESEDYSWVSFLKERGWQPMKYSSFNEFWRVLLDQGGWWNPDIKTRPDRELYRTRSGKFEFYSTFLKNAVEKNIPGEGKTENELNLILNEFGIESRGDYVFLPHYEKMSRDAFNYPVQLIPFWIYGNYDESGSRLGLIQEMTGIHVREYWNMWAELNPETADMLQIQEDMYIDVITRNRSITVKAKIRPSVMHDSIVLPLGIFEGEGNANLFELLTPEIDLLSGIGSMFSTRVRIRRSEKNIHA